MPGRLSDWPCQKGSLDAFPVSRLMEGAYMIRIRSRITLAGALFITLAAVVPARAHPIQPGAGPHSYPSVLCWDGTDGSILNPAPDKAPLILWITANFNKKLIAGDEWLTWRPFWRNRVTGEFITYRNFFPLIHLPPFELFSAGDMPTAFPANDPTSLLTTNLPFKRGYYDVGATYAWWDPVNRGWIYDHNWIPNSYNTGYLRLIEGQGIQFDYLCGLDPGRFRFTITLPPIGSALAPRISRLQRSTRKDLLEGRTVMQPRAVSSRAIEIPGQCGRGVAPPKRVIVGTEGPDVIVGTKRADVILGFGGDDVLDGGGGSDVICGGDGNDVLLGAGGPDRLSGGTGNDTILGESGADVLLGGQGGDIVEGGAGNDRANGGGQSLDIIAYLFAPQGVEVNFATGTATGNGSDQIKGFDTVVGSPWNDRLLGQEGEQWFVPMGGDDVVDGSEGGDVLAYVVSVQAISVDLASGVATGEGTDTLTSLETVIGSPHDDSIIGDASYNYLLGLDGDDHLDGLAGEDTLEGGGGNDVCVRAAAFIGCENLPGDVFPEPSVGEPPPEPPT